MSDSAASVWLAPAKLNLFLLVTSRRPDGYHEIQTLFRLINLFDELTIEVTDSKTIARLGDDYGVAESDDLVVRAAQMLQAHANVRKGARIRVNKQIPLGAGLGGGSSDAATALLALNRLWRCNLTLNELALLAVSLGADVPVFIHGQTALATGIGEKLQYVEMGQSHYLLIFSPMQISTAEVFQHPDLVRNSSPISFSQALAGAGKNDCEPVVFKLHPEIECLFKDLEAWGKPRMTGTGSCVFLSMPDENAAKSAAREIKCRYNVRAVRGLDRSPVHEKLGLALRASD